MSARHVREGDTFQHAGGEAKVTFVSNRLVEWRWADMWWVLMPGETDGACVALLASMNAAGLYAPWQTVPTTPRIAIRPNDDGTVDDVVIRDVSMVRLEQLGDHLWWMRCHLDGDDYVEFNIDYDGCIHEVSIADPDAYTWEDGSMA